MSSTTNIINPGSQHPDEGIKATLQERLRSTIAFEWFLQAYQVAHEYCEHILQRAQNDAPAERRWTYDLHNADEDVYEHMHAEALKDVERLLREYHLDQRPDTEAWRRWLVEKAEEFCRTYARGSAKEIASRMADYFSGRYSTRFSYHYADEEALFVIADGEDMNVLLGGTWEALYDAILRGEHKGDADYLRVRYTYNADERLLLRLHHTYVPLPSGGWSLEWVLSAEWKGVTPEEAQQIVASEVGEAEE